MLQNYWQLSRRWFLKFTLNFLKGCFLNLGDKEFQILTP